MSYRKSPVFCQNDLKVLIIVWNLKKGLLFCPKLLFFKRKFHFLAKIAIKVLFINKIIRKVLIFYKNCLKSPVLYQTHQKKSFFLEKLKKSPCFIKIVSKVLFVPKFSINSSFFLDKKSKINIFSWNCQESLNPLPKHSKHPNFYLHCKKKSNFWVTKKIQFLTKIFQKSHFSLKFFTSSIILPKIIFLPKKKIKKF